MALLPTKNILHTESFTFFLVRQSPYAQAWATLAVSLNRTYHLPVSQGIVATGCTVYFNEGDSIRSYKAEQLPQRSITLPSIAISVNNKTGGNPVSMKYVLRFSVVGSSVCQRNTGVRLGQDLGARQWPV